MTAPSIQQFRLVRSASLNGYIELVKSLGYDPRAFLRGVGLSARLLENPETLIPSPAVRELLEVTAQVTGVEDFALRLAARRTFSNLGPISLVLKEAATPREALDTLCRYLKLLSAALITRVEDVGDAVIIREDLLPTPGLSSRQALELAMGVTFRMLRELIGPRWRPQQVCFMHRPPADLSPYRAFFGRNPMFNQPFNGMVCAAADLSMSRMPDDPGVARFARDYLEAALRHREIGIRDSCRELVQALLPGGRCTADQVARHLGVDRRTLHRYLSAEGLTFSTLLHEVRSELVMRHLLESDMPMGEVAGLLGFSAQSSFSHWFQTVFGCSATDWRRTQSAQPGKSGKSGQVAAAAGRRAPSRV
ncbi:MULTISPECIES: AraC family transcriptional regulator [Cupriavidus]|jgi:AraC-like DNA-binding protein|uniref:AraC family transcriptional regulator n=1 Tax=Cupriavidus TaxID=106589 RepID=UPI000465DBC4|nr:MULTISPECIES: AraC family transcriptional regulator [Cupriavidus]KWR86479.1 AraC family transcriptional regulator [Cupriavidus sp. SHE]QWC90367.1 AraC family transcriptional regulator [Cupriavidus metallidurans]